MCEHGLVSRPGETSSIVFLNELLVLFKFPPKSGVAQLEGVLLLRYCATKFAGKVPSWRLPLKGNVADLVTEGVRKSVLFILLHVRILVLVLIFVMGGRALEESPT